MARRIVENHPALESAELPQFKAARHLVWLPIPLYLAAAIYLYLLQEAVEMGRTVLRGTSSRRSAPQDCVANQAGPSDFFTPQGSFFTPNLRRPDLYFFLIGGDMGFVLLGDLIFVGGVVAFTILTCGMFVLFDRITGSRM